MHELVEATQDIEDQIKNIRNNISDLEREIIEHRKPAEDLNRDLKNYLDHDELKFDAKDNGYLITELLHFFRRITVQGNYREYFV